MQLYGNGIFEKKGIKKGNTTTIMVGIHGNERAGIAVLNEIIQTIKIISGTVYFIYANLKAIEENVRFIDENLNRCFLNDYISSSYEWKRAQEIMSILNKSDYLLDVHNTLNEANSIPFLISEYNDLGNLFPIEIVVSGIDSLHPGGSDGYMNSLGKIGLCIECGSIYDTKGPQIAKTSIINLLKFTGNIEGTYDLFYNQKFIKYYEIYKNKTLDFKFIKTYKDFEKVNKGEIIGYDGKIPIIVPENSIILFPYNPKKIEDECFILGKQIL